MDVARRQHLAMLTQAQTNSPSSNLSAAWQPVGPNQVASLAYGNVTGRVTAIAIDPADPTGNTVYLGTTGGGVWKSANAAGPAASVTFTPLTDTLPVFSANVGTSAIPSLSIGAISLQPGVAQGGVLLAGTGDPNDATDSYYGSGLLRSADGGVTWSLIQNSMDGLNGNHTFSGLGFAGFAWSGATPGLVVAAVSQAAEGVLVNAVNAGNSVMGIYYSTDAGVTWQMATLMDGSQTLQSPALLANYSPGRAATAIVWNPVRQRFYAAVRFHGYYQSADGQTWTRLANQPGTGLTLANCPTAPTSEGNSRTCPLFRGALAVQPNTGDTFALTVDGNNLDQGLWQDACSLSSGNCANPAVTFATQLASAPMEAGNGSTAILQGDYNLTLAAVPAGSASPQDTLLFAGTVDLYRCSLAAGCALRNTTNAQNGCAAPARVAPAQHAIAALATSAQPLLYLGNDGGLWRSTDGVNQQAAPCSADDANHFQNLNAGLGSLAEVVSFAQSPADAATLLVSLGANGTASTASASSPATPWTQLSPAEGGTVAIDQTDPLLWYVSTAAGVSIRQCPAGVACAAADFTGPPTIGAAQVAGDDSLIHAPWLLDPALPSDILIGTCRVWRGPAGSGTAWSSANAISRLFAGPQNASCGPANPVIRSLAAAGPPSTANAAQNAGSTVLYAGMAGALDGGGSAGGHLFSTSAANIASSATLWTDLAASPVTNSSGGGFNPGGFDISSLAADPHDATGATIYATVMGFAGNGINAAHLYRSTDFGAHWTNISSNLPSAPANSVVIDPNDANTVYVALDTGIYVTQEVTSCSNVNCWGIYGAHRPDPRHPGLPLHHHQRHHAGPEHHHLQHQQLDHRLADANCSRRRLPPDREHLRPQPRPQHRLHGRDCVHPNRLRDRGWNLHHLRRRRHPDRLSQRHRHLPPTDALAPLALTFAAQQIDSASAAQQVILTNAGDQPLTLIAAQITSGDFTAVNACGNSLNPHSSCSIQVAFAPKNVGVLTGVLTVSDQYRSQTVALNGFGLAPPGVSLAPFAALNFPSTGVGITSPGQIVTLTNNSSVPLQVQNIAFSGDFAIAPGSNTCGAVLAVLSACTLQVVFVPTAAGPRAGTLTVADNAPNSPQILVLNGAGVDFTLASNGPSTVTTSNGQNAVFPLLLSSAANVSGTVSFTCTGMPANSTCNVNPASVALGNTTTISVTVLTGVSTASLQSQPLRTLARMIVLAMLLPLGLLGTRKMRLPRLASLCLFCLLIVATGCGASRAIPAENGSNPNPTPGPITAAGTYTLVASAASAGLTRTVNLTLIVQ